MSRVNWLGAAIWGMGMTSGVWAPHKPVAVVGLATLALAVIGLILLWWPRR
jgi:hypothetical protein